MKIIKYFKLPWIQNTDSIPVTGGFHGNHQAKTAMDFSPYPLIAPMDGCTITGSSSSGQNQYFNLNLPVNGRVYIQCVHGRPTRLGTFSKGEVCGVVNAFIHPKTKTRQDHWHLSINVNGVWFGLMTFIDRILPIQLIGSPWTTPYNKWNFYNDRSLSKYVEVPANTEINLPIKSPDNDVPFIPPQPQPANPNITTLPINNMPTIGVTPDKPDINVNLPLKEVDLKMENKELKEQNSNLYVNLDKKTKANNIWLEKLKSRKLWTAIVAISFSIISVYKPELKEVLTEVWTIALGYIGIQGIDDIINPK